MLLRIKRCLGLSKILHQTRFSRAKNVILSTRQNRFTSLIENVVTKFFQKLRSRQHFQGGNSSSGKIMNVRKLTYMIWFQIGQFILKQRRLQFLFKTFFVKQLTTAIKRFRFRGPQRQEQKPWKKYLPRTLSKKKSIHKIYLSLCSGKSKVKYFLAEIKKNIWKRCQS